MSNLRPDHRPSSELLEAVHSFPGTYQIKAIGAAQDDFPGRVLAAATLELATASEVDLSVRSTRHGRHVAVTLDICVQSSDQVRAIYSRISQVEGLTLLL